MRSRRERRQIDFDGSFGIGSRGVEARLLDGKLGAAQQEIRHRVAARGICLRDGHRLVGPCCRRSRVAARLRQRSALECKRCEADTLRRTRAAKPRFGIIQQRLGPRKIAELSISDRAYEYRISRDNCVAGCTRALVSVVRKARAFLDALEPDQYAR